VQSTVQWASARDEQLWTRACANCHRNQTQWPWYIRCAPAFWIAAVDVNDGRQAYNISELDKVPSFVRSNLPNEAAQRIRNGLMPPADFLLLHPEARLSDAEKQQLIQALQTALASR
jgi:Haem-binding domain